MSDTAPAVNRRASKVYSGLLPPVFDTVLASYPDPLTEQYTYSYVDLETQVNKIAKVIEVTYTDASKTFLSSVKTIYTLPF